MQPETSSARLAFTGSALGLFGRWILLLIASFLIIPYPWFAVLILVWFADNTEYGGMRGEFFGECRERWLLLGTIAFLSSLPTYADMFANLSETSPGVNGLLVLATSIANWLLSFYVLTWTVSRFRLEDGETFEFTGSLGGFVGRNLLITLSLVTIVGWAWALAYYLRWICANTRGQRTTFAFEGSGFGLLWRIPAALSIPGIAVGVLIAGLNDRASSLVLAGVGGILCLAAIAALPWILAWLTRWIVGSVSMRRAEE